MAKTIEDKAKARAKRIAKAEQAAGPARARLQRLADVLGLAITISYDIVNDGRGTAWRARTPETRPGSFHSLGESEIDAYTALVRHAQWRLE